ncbi:MAG: hypothetical protein ABJA82_00115 [Myxococcales bacterium]
MLLLPVVLTFAATLVVLSWTQELFTTSAGLRRQLATHGVYGRTIFGDDHHYKVLLFHSRRPRVLALGSSRTMQFRESFFRPEERFMTAGGAMSSLAEGRQFIEETFRDHAPELVIVGLDYWWFNERAGDERTGISGEKYESYGYVLSAGVGSLGRLFPHLLSRRSPQAPFSSAGAVGSRAWAFGDGFRTDGSHAAAFFYNRFGEEDGLLDPDYRNTLRRVREQSHPFEGGDAISAARRQQLDELVRAIRGHGARPLLFLPPFSPPVFEALTSSPHHAVFARVRELCASYQGETGVPCRDESLMPISHRGCYMDGFHASEHLFALIASRLVPPERLDQAEVARLTARIDSGCPVLGLTDR